MTNDSLPTPDPISTSSMPGIDAQDDSSAQAFVRASSSTSKPAGAQPDPEKLIDKVESIILEDNAPVVTRPDKPRQSAKRGTDAQSGNYDQKLVNQTKKQIQTLVEEISALSKSDCNVEEFYEGFLTRVTSALASIGGAIWVRDSDEKPLNLHYQINLKQTKLGNNQVAQVQHSMLLAKLANSAEPTLVPPNSGSELPEEAANPTEFLLLVGPLVIDSEVIGLVEIFQRPGAGPTTQRGYLRFLTQMCNIASDFLKNQRLRLFDQQQTMWQQLEQFIRSVHNGLDTDQTVFTIANEARRLIDCDRVSVALSSGRRCRVKSVSGLDSIERRAEQVKELSQLATSVVRAGEPVWYDGENELPPQIEKRMQSYIDKSHTKMLAIIPLHQVDVDENVPENVAADKSKPLGAIIVEQLKDSRISPSLEKRVEVVVNHSQVALTNAINHNSIFLMPVWRAIGKITPHFQGTKLIRTLLAMLAFAVLGFILCFLPYPFELGAKGALVPQTQHEVFAEVDGILQEILVQDRGKTIVQRNQVLARMTNNDLLVQIESLEGELRQNTAQRNRFEDAFNEVKGDSIADAVAIDGELASIYARERSLTNELNLKKQELKKLEVRAPADGQVINWQVRQSLLRRPVSKGQNLMTIIDPDTQWEIELEMPERRVAHLIKAQRSSEEPLKVSFALVSHPGKEFAGTLLNLDYKLGVHSDEGNTALIRVSFKNDEVPFDLLRAGTRVNAKVNCGETSIGYSLCHELIETVQSTWMYWF